MRSLFKAFAALAVSLLILSPVAALASPLPYINTPMDTINAGLNTVTQNINNNLAPAASLVTASGTTTSTATGVRLQISITGLTTAAAGTTSATMTVTDTSVTAASQILCNVNLYAGTGVPITTNIIPGAGSFTFTITNVAASGSLNATVVSSCLVFN